MSVDDLVDGGKVLVIGRREGGSSTSGFVLVLQEGLSGHRG